MAIETYGNSPMIYLVRSAEHKLHGPLYEIHLAYVCTGRQCVIVPPVRLRTIRALAFTISRKPMPLTHSFRSGGSVQPYVGHVPRPAAWIIEGRMITPADLHKAAMRLPVYRRRILSNWFALIVEEYRVGDEPFLRWYSDHAKLPNEELRKRIEEAGGVRKLREHPPLFWRKMVTEYGVSFWALAAELGFEEKTIEAFYEEKRADKEKQSDKGGEQ